MPIRGLIILPAVLVAFALSGCRAPRSTSCAGVGSRRHITPWPAEWFDADARIVSPRDTSPPPSVVELVEKVRPSIVRIEVREAGARLILKKFNAACAPFPIWTLISDTASFFWTLGTRALGPYPRRYYGSGFFIHRDGLIVTNAHVVANAARITVFTYDGKAYRAEKLGADERFDLALLRVQNAGKRYPPLIMRDDRTLKIGEEVIIAGHPFNFELSVARGVVSSVHARIGLLKKEAFIFTDTDINPGDSGGPLLDRFGQVVGINSAGFFYDKKAAFSIPISFLIANMDRIIANTPLNRPALGALVSYSRLPDALAAESGRDFGIVVMRVMPYLKRALQHASVDLPVSAVITAFNGHRLRTAQDMIYEICRSRAGEPVTIDYLYLRQGQTVRCSITFKLPAEPLIAPGILY